MIDKPNSGILGEPDSQTNLIRTGNLNINGKEVSVALVKVVTAKGNEVYEIYGQLGALFKNQKTKDTQPDLQGKCFPELQWTKEEDRQKFLRCSMWKKIGKDNKPYVGVALSEPPKKEAEY